jgi:ATP-dependent DNA ligase
MVAKRRSSPYVGILTADRLKVKCIRTHDFVIGVWVTDGAGALNSVLLGEFVEGDFRYLGRVENNLAPRVAYRSKGLRRTVCEPAQSRKIQDEATALLGGTRRAASCVTKNGPRP